MAEVPGGICPAKTGRVVILIERGKDLTDTALLSWIILCYLLHLRFTYLADPSPSDLTGGIIRTNIASHCIIQDVVQDVLLGAPNSTEPRSSLWRPLWRRLLSPTSLDGDLVTCGLGLCMSSFVLCRRLSSDTMFPHPASCGPLSNKIISKSNAIEE